MITKFARLEFELFSFPNSLYFFIKSGLKAFKSYSELSKEGGADEILHFNFQIFQVDACTFSGVFIGRMQRQNTLLI